MKRIRKFFKSKTIVHSKRLFPGLLIKRFEANGKQYARIAFTNRVKHKGCWPMTDVKWEDVTMLVRIPSPARTMLLRLFKLKARVRVLRIERKSKSR